MSMIMNHDMTAIMGQRIMQRNSLAMKRSLEKLSTGLRTKIADVDNTAGLAISETMMSRIGGKEKALQNAQDGISMIQTAAGALDQTQSMLQRMRELSVQAANDTLTQQDRSYIQVEINEIRDEITNLGNNTQFNRKNILSGDNAVLWSSTNENVKAVVHGGLRSIDSYGQKYAVDGNYRITVKAEVGKAQVQKTDILKIKHDSTTELKTLNTKSGVVGVSASNVPSGDYSITFAESAEPATEGVLTGSYGIGGMLNGTENAVTFAEEIGAPVTKITVATTDGVEIWSTSGSDLFRNVRNGSVTTAADQSAFFEGRTDVTNGPAFVGVKDEVIASAREKGIILSGFEEADSESGSLNLTAQRLNGDATGITISYETEAPGVAPVTETTAADSVRIGADEVFAVEVTDQNLDNASVLFEVTNMDAVNGMVTLKATASKLSQDGRATTAVQDNIILTMGADGETPNTVSLFKLFGGTDDSPAATITLGENGTVPIQKGAKFVYSIKAGAEAEGNDNPIQLNITSTPEGSDPESWSGGAFGGQQVEYLLNGETNASSELNFRQFFVNSENGSVSQGNITLRTNANFKAADAGGEINPENNNAAASFRAGYVGEVATSSTKLRDIDKFWTNEGIYVLEQPKELTLTQGDGRQAKIMLYGNDTVGDLTRKLNDAVANGLGQAKYVDDSGNFVSFVEGATPGQEGVEGTLVIRSVLPGTKGEITLSGNEDLLKTLSLNTIQESKETSYEVTVRDAHDGELIAQKVNITGNMLVGVIHSNIDVEFDPMLDVSVAWNDKTKSFDFTNTGGDNGTDVVLHLADNTTIFQAGDSEGDDVMVAIGDMRAHALGLDGVNVMSRDRAAYSTTLIDAAIDRVSMQQAKLGAAQNRLEHHIGNLTKETEMLTEANSRIRDVDYMTEIMNFTTQKILMDANTAMLAQANQIQQSTIMRLLP
ncbi:MAG: flagellin [Synergistaceae bacterium]|nr:flagellin [Synergistaceae bacterium]